VPVPEAVLSPLARRALDWYLMSEDLPSKDSQVRVDGDRIILDWQPTNLRAHAMLVQRMKEVFRAAGYPLILTKPFGNKAPSHQCGTIRMGTDPATAPLDPLCRSYDHPNLLVVDAAFLPTSAAVNPSLTVAAQALRVSRALA
jgi:choline dehydrogenase-like flavoprotein